MLVQKVDFRLKSAQVVVSIRFYLNFFGDGFLFFFAQTMPVEISDFQFFSDLSFDSFVMHGEVSFR